ncbi:two pore domain potassium channel family protein [Streptomyces sp. NPDC055752]
MLPLDDRLTAGTAVPLVCGLFAVLLVFCWEVRAIMNSLHPRLKAVEGLGRHAGAVPGPLRRLLLSAGPLGARILQRAAEQDGRVVLHPDHVHRSRFRHITALSQTARVLTMAQMTGGLLLVGVVARVMASAVQAGLNRQR